MKKCYLSVVLGIAASCLATACAGGGEEPEERAKQPEIVVGQDANGPDGDWSAEEGETEGTLGNEAPESAENDTVGGSAAGSKDGAEVKEFATVKEIGADFFIVAKIETEEFEDGSSIAVMSLSEDDWEMYDVLYTDETEFIVRNLSRDGMEHTDDIGSAADLEADVDVNLTGSWEDGRFRAAQVIILHFTG